MYIYNSKKKNYYILYILFKNFGVFFALIKKN